MWLLFYGRKTWFAGSQFFDQGLNPGPRQRKAQSLNHTMQILLILFIYLFLAVLYLCCYAGFSLVATSRACSLVAASRLLIAVASLVAEHGLQGAEAQQLRLTGTRAWAQPQLPGSMWSILRPGIEPMSPALADGFLTTGAPMKFKQQMLELFPFVKWFIIVVFWNFK